MRIDNTQGTVVFDRLVSVVRDFGSEESISVTKDASMPKPAEVALAENATGVFASRTLEEINASAKGHAQNLKAVLVG